MKERRLRTADGLEIAAYEAGNPDGPAILFIHGFNQCHLCWEAQFADPGLRRQFRLVAYDVRGHGASSQPDNPVFYSDDRRFADDTRLVIEALGLKRPVLVGWSYAGRLIEDYIRFHGTGGISGINYVCARTNNDPAFEGDGLADIPVMRGNQPGDERAAVEGFVRACFHKSPGEAEIARIIAYNMKVRPATRTAHLGRAPSDGAIMKTINVPVLVTQGAHDTLVLPGLADVTATAIPDAKLSLYADAGHAPFAEEPERFNRELAEFVVRCNS